MIVSLRCMIMLISPPISFLLNSDYSSFSKEICLVFSVGVTLTEAILLISNTGVKDASKSDSFRLSSTWLVSFTNARVGISVESE